MSGEGFALLAALSYGLAGVTIAKGKLTARGDNGVFLSIIVTACASGVLWLGWGQVPASALTAPNALEPIAVFIVAGLFSMVLGRTTMYRATEQIGPVAASLLRRLTPVLALPIGIVFLAEVPGGRTLLGAGLVIVAVLIYIGRPASYSGGAISLGWILGIGSAAFYAASYTLRSYGLDHLPDPAFGTFIGALAGMIWLLASALIGPKRLARMRRLFLDRGPWHWLTAVALSAGQIFQFFALKSATVVVVATLGSLEVFFTALLGAILIGQTQARDGRVWLSAGVAAGGTALLMW